jgi:hypothetical protein
MNKKAKDVRKKHKKAQERAKRKIVESKAAAKSPRTRKAPAKKAAAPKEAAAAE